MFIERLENFYLQVLRIVILIIASIALLVAVVAGVRSGVLYFAKASLIPETIKGETNPTFDKFVKFQQSKKDNKPTETPLPTPASIEEANTFREEREKIVSAIDRFNREVNSISPELTTLKEQILKVTNQLPQGIRSDYINSLITFTSDLEKNIPTAKSLKDQGKLNYDIMEGLSWHLNSFKKEIENIRNQNQAALNQIAERRAEIPFWLYTSLIAFGFFLVIVFYSILVKIERNLRHTNATNA